MSFTDNRQDASLQAGHFNDFIQVGLLRAGLFKALQEKHVLEHYNVTQAVFKAIGLDQRLYAKEPAQYGPGRARNEDSFQRLLEYRLYEDLRRGWRVAQPNLEQCGLLIIEQSIASRPVQTERHSSSKLLTETKKAMNCFNSHLHHKVSCGGSINAGGVPTAPDSLWIPRLAFGRVVLMMMTTRLMLRVTAFVQV